jgi:hypothetical protein
MAPGGGAQRPIGAAQPMNQTSLPTGTLTSTITAAPQTNRVGQPLAGANQPVNRAAVPPGRAFPGAERDDDVV